LNRLRTSSGMREKLYSPHMAEDITSKRPIIKAASACVWSGDEILLIQRGNALGYGFWSFPGGKIEEGESAQDAAVRELFEETNISANLQHFVGEFEIDSGDVRFVISCFTGFYVSGESVAKTDAKAVAWAHWQQIGRFSLAPNIAAAVALARKLISL
jgi:8-oxo-dGTP diphosphatase